MDNRQLLMPFINLKMIGKLYNPDTYQYHQLAFNIESDKPEENVHCLVTTLKSAMVHPIVQNTPLDLRNSLFIFRHIRAALGLVNINFHDTRRETNYLTLDMDKNISEPILYIKYVPNVEEQALIKHTIKTVKHILRRLKCIVPPRMIHVRPMGASVHYAGTIPMTKERRAFATSEYCQSHDFENLYIVDGSTFPFLPAKNITFTLMANAIRVAECAF
jgi:choline dehydrogenase-like flavoprotein